MKTILKMENVKKSFGSGHNEIQALKGIDLAVNQGEFVSIIGPSGSGKSTFLTIAGGLQSPTSGNISINGLDFTPLSEKKRSKLRFKEIGFILQSSNLIPYLTIEEQFLLIDKINHEKLTSKKGIELLKSLDILDLKDKHPSDLSGGERPLNGSALACGTSTFNEPNLILADEPTASLDTEHAYQVVELLRQEAHLKNKATIMVTHDQRMIKNSDSIYKIEDGLLSKI